MEKLNAFLEKNGKLLKYAGCGLLLGFLIVFPMVVSSKYVLFLMLQVFINSIIILGLNIIAGLTGQNHFATGAIFSLGAYTSAILTTKLGCSVWVGVLAAIAMGWLIGKLLGYPGLKLNSVFLWLVTASFCEVINLLERNLVGLTNGTQGIKKIPSFELFGTAIKTNKQMYYLYLAFAVLALLLTLRIVHSRWGRVFRAVRDNEESMRSNGVDDAGRKILAFTISTIFASFAGALYAHSYNYVTPTAFVNLSTNYLVMLMVGGFGSIPGSILGAALITLLPEQLRFLEGSYWLIFSGITLLMTLFMPKGIVSLFDLRSEDSPVGRLLQRRRGKEEHHV